MSTNILQYNKKLNRYEMPANVLLCKTKLNRNEMSANILQHKKQKQRNFLLTYEVSSVALLEYANGICLLLSFHSEIAEK